MAGKWGAVKIEDVAQKVATGPFGSRIKTENFVSEGVPVIRGNNLNAERFLDDEFAYLTEAKADELSSSNAFPLDIVVTHRGTLGQVGIIPSNADYERYVVSQSQMKINVDPNKADPVFVFYYLRSPEGQHQLLANSSQTGVPAIASPTRSLKAIVVPSPTLSEQRAIAHILGTLDDKIELNRRMNETLEEMARAIFKSWFVDFDPVRAKAESRDPGLPEHIADLFPDRFEESELGEIPAGWKADTLGDISQKPQYGFTASANSEPIGPKFLRIADINKQAWIDWASVPFCSVSPENYEKYKAQIGDILIARMADPGHGVMIEEEVDAVIASYLIRFEPRDAEYSRYIQYWLRSDAYWELVKARSAGTTRANLNAKVLSVFPLILPSRAVASAFREVVNSLRSTVVSNVEQSHTLATIRDALLPRLISGELRVKDAERSLQETMR